ncbi:substrate-binding domain-containing protein [Planococcus sp. APC 3906]|uniref:substrate-binding domain-containing protein n=1 Tax=Planococcus sp. APC 3906 TaxID=3035194 RepID=UPI0025B2D68A|nr:substrate-binding domain-containing protein [Planococcus sp. APC 3906]MDN3451291.1 substrate-binding domain-containing protein [Planococcus sp. APC 3906]
MRKKVIIVLLSLSAIFLVFTIASAEKVFRPSTELPKSVSTTNGSPRLVLITQELETSFWDEVAAGAKNMALEEGAQLDVWGSYGTNSDEFLKKLELAIHSKMDGIIVQGLDTEAFNELTKVKAAFYGIPIITVANDVPKQESLRKTYVGSDQFDAGNLLAKELLIDMEHQGEIIILSDEDSQYYQQQRIAGMMDVFKAYPAVTVTNSQTSSSKEQVVAAAQDFLNKSPDAKGIVAVNANHLAAMLQEISRRTQVEPYHIYSFDDGPDALALLEQGEVDALIRQSPEEMGKKSVELMIDWIASESEPLDTEGYITDIELVKRVDGS